MKIAIVGNMNNNGVSLLNNLKKYSHNADLFLYLNDGTSSNAHFNIDNNTYSEINGPVGYTLPIINGPEAILTKTPLKYLFHIYSFITNSRSRKQDHNKVNYLLSSYDLIICHGILPAYLQLHNLKVKRIIFYPVSTGVEYINADRLRDVNNSSNLLKIISYILAKKILVRALKKKNVTVCNTELSVTSETLSCHSIKFKKIFVPCVTRWVKRDKQAVIDINDKSINIISHARHYWVENKYNRIYNKHIKNNQWILYSIKDIMKMCKGIDIVVHLFEYGKDVDFSKKLIQDLKISSFVKWHPLSPKKYISSLLNKCDIGIGEFTPLNNTIWGSTGWEILGSGIPLLTYNSWNQSRFMLNYGVPMPPIPKIICNEDLTIELYRLLIDTNKRERIGAESLEWVDNYYDGKQSINGFINS